MWFNGHDHTLGHMRTPDAVGTDFFWVGSSGTVDPLDGVPGSTVSEMDFSNLTLSSVWNASVYSQGYGWDFLRAYSGFAIVTLWQNSVSLPTKISALYKKH